MLKEVSLVSFGRLTGVGTKWHTPDKTALRPRFGHYENTSESRTCFSGSDYERFDFHASCPPLDDACDELQRLHRRRLQKLDSKLLCENRFPGKRLQCSRGAMAIENRTENASANRCHSIGVFGAGTPVSDNGTIA